MVSKPAENTQLCASSFVAQKNSLFNNISTNDNKTLKAPMKPKTQPKPITKGKKQPDILKIKK